MQKKNILLLGKYFKKKTLKFSILNYLKKRYNIEFFNEFEKFKSKKYDLVICYGYGKILTKKQIKLLKCNIINLHIGYLPFARGIYPLVWSLVFNKPLGITLHLIQDDKIDNGQIIYKEKLNLKKRDNLKQIHFNSRKLIEKFFFKNYKKLFSYKKNKLQKNQQRKKFYFTKKMSQKLIDELPNKWETKASYIQKNSKKFKSIYITE